MTAQIQNPIHALAFLLAGNATTTFRSQKTGTHFTYHVAVNKNPLTVNGPSHFVEVLTGPDDYTYIGCIYKSAVFMHGNRSKLGPSTPSVIAFTWVWGRLSKGKMHEQLDVYHEGKCGRCGRQLTHPESIESGLGPECAKKMAASS